MKLSIRVKLLFYMTVNILIFSIVLLGFNIIFTKQLFISHKKDILYESSKKIQALIKSYPNIDFKSVEYDLNRLERTTGGSVFVGTSEGKIYYPPVQSPGGPPRMNPFFAEGSIPPNNKITSYENYGDNSFFVITEDPNLMFETLRFQTTLDNGIEVLIWLPMSEISESIGVFNKIVAFTAVVILFGSVLWSMFVSNKFAKPISQINNIAKKIAAQDFTEKLDINGNDEISQLSVSINELSHKLSSYIGLLNAKNIKLEKDIIYEKRLDKMRKEFVSGVSHELKTPLFLIQGYAEGLKNVIHEEKKRVFYCDVIMNETEKMDRLLKDLLDLAQIEAGMFAVEKELFDVVSLSENTLYKFQRLFDDKKINIQLFFPDCLTVYADPIRTEQIIVNFINNAVNYLDEKKEITVTITYDDKKAKISVFNSGKNIPEDVIGKIWTSFYKADESRAREYGGIGLGLSIVRAIQEGHKNGYGVHNTENGVEFWITLDLGDNRFSAL